MNFPRQSKEELSLNLTPLIDIVFLLLIFFMVSTTFTKENHLSLNLPESSGEVVESQIEVIEIIISATGSYSVNDQALINSQLSTIKAAIQKVSNGDKSIPMVITADAKTPHEAVVRAMDAAGQMGFTKLSITTQKPVEASN